MLTGTRTGQATDTTVGIVPTGPEWRKVVEGFSETAADYAVSMAPSLRTMAVRVVQRARLQVGERILDAGTGTGVGAAASLTSGREVVGVDAAPGMLAVARAEVRGARFLEADFANLPFPSASFHVVISVHALHLAVDPVATLAEWRRITVPGGRLSLSALVDIREISNAHVHVKTLNGPITLTNIQNGHVEITSVSGDVILNEVNGPFVQVSSTTGKIRYAGDFGAGGEYSLSSHSGDIEATMPDDASADVTARSVRGHVENEFPLLPKHHTVFPIEQGRSFVGTVGGAASSVLLRTFSGKIRLKKR